MDFSRDAQPVRSPFLRHLLIAIGTISLVIGAIGIFLPVLPTTPFLLLTAACYARSSKKFYVWLMTNRYFGPVLYTWRYERRIPKRAKIVAVLTLAISMSITIVYFIPVTGVKILLALIAISVMVYISHFPS